MKKAKDIMSHKLTVVNEDAQLREVVEILSKNKLSGVPVVDQQHKVIGYISEKDIVVSAFPERLKFENPEVISLKELAPLIMKISGTGAPLVKDYMNKTLCFVAEETPLADLLEVMLARNLKRLPVIRDGYLVGVIERSALSQINQESGHSS